MTNYNDGNWWGWNGGECPVHPGTVVEYVCRYSLRDEDVAENLVWDGSEEYCDPIIAFRVTKEHKEPREFLIDTSTMQIVTAGFEGMPCIIHVREVMEGEE